MPIVALSALRVTCGDGARAYNRSAFVRAKRSAMSLVLPAEKSGGCRAQQTRTPRMSSAFGTRSRKNAAVKCSDIERVLGCDALQSSVQVDLIPQSACIRDEEEQGRRCIRPYMPPSPCFCIPYPRRCCAGQSHPRGVSMVSMPLQSQTLCDVARADPRSSFAGHHADA